MSNEERRGGEFITRYEAQNMTTEALKTYEREVVAPRHLETQTSLRLISAENQEIKSMVSEGKGMRRLAGWLGAAAATLWIALQIAHAITGHSITIGSN